MMEALRNAIFSQEPQARKSTIKDMAYGSGRSRTIPYRTFRLDHSTPVYRRAVPVTVIPQFKTVTIFTPTTVNAATKAFQTNVTGVSVRWPQGVK